MWPIISTISRPTPTAAFPYTTLSRSLQSGQIVRTYQEQLLVTEEACDAVYIMELPTNEQDLAQIIKRSEEHTSELQSVASSYAVFCLIKKMALEAMITQAESIPYTI